jgi:hypothetical protein
MRTPACSMRKRTGASGRSISLINALHAGLFHLGLQRRNQRMNRRRARGQRGRRRLIVARRHIGQRLRGVRGIQRVREQHGVVHRAAQRNSLRLSTCSASFQSCTLGNGRIFKQRAQLGVKPRRSAPRLAQTPTLKLAFFSAASATSSSEKFMLRLPLLHRGFGLLASSAKANPWRAQQRRMRRPAHRLALQSTQPKGLIPQAQVAQHRCEFKLGEKLAAGLDVRRLRLHRASQPAAHGCRW